MKSPEHFGSVKELRTVLPEAVILQVHRDPLTCFLSMNSMLYNIHKSATLYSDRKALATANMELFKNEMARNKSFRESADNGIIDVWYDDLIADPLLVVEQAYQKAGLTFSESFRENMKAYARSNPKDKFGAHKYRAEDFGLAEDEITDKLYPLRMRS